MSEADEIAPIRALFEETTDEWPGKAFDLLAEDVVIAASSGQLFVGHEGYAGWYELQLKGRQAGHFEGFRYESLGDGWVLVGGTAVGELRSGERVRQPGCWLVRVHDGKIAASVYCRTEGEARGAFDDE